MPTSVYVEMVDFKGWEAKVAWDDLKFGLAHDLDFDRIAVVVGSSRWQQWMIKVSNIFFSADIRYFSAAEQDQEIDLILAGSHGHHGLERVSGSVAAGLVRKVDCDVLTVHL